MSQRVASQARLFLPQPRPSVTGWLQDNITLSRKTSPHNAGRFSCDSRPFMRPILETWNPANGINSVALAAAVQLLKTLTMVLGGCYRMKYEPVPALFVGPTTDWAKKEISRKRLHPLIRENPVLAALMPANPDLFTLTGMSMEGGELNVIGANSDTALSGGTFGICAIDEASKITQEDSDESPEAHPILLARDRTQAYLQSAFNWMSSTPNSPFHLFWQGYLAGDQTHFPVPCPHCGHWFCLDMEEDKETGYRSITWDQSARDALGVWNKAKVIESARLICPKNGCRIENKHKASMIRQCEEERRNPHAARNERSFRIPALYNPDLTIGQHAIDFILASSDLFGLQGFYNHKRALPWEDVAANIKDEDVRKLRDLSRYERGTISRRPYGLTLTADVGDAVTHWEVLAVMPDDEIHLIDWGTVTTIEDLNGLQHKLKYRIAGTDEWIAPCKGLVDCRDQSVRVYTMCHHSLGFWYPAGGSDAKSGTWGMQQLPQYGTQLYYFNTHQLKKYLYADLIKQQKAPRFYLPANADEDIIHGHGGQQLIKEGSQEAWKKIPWDHFGDCSLRGVLAMLIWRADQGRSAPDMPVQPGRDYQLKPA